MSKEEQRKSKAEGFWEAFRFTENGKPKSSLVIYTFSLSVLFAAVYALCYEGAIRLLTGPLASLPAWGSNLVISLAASGIGAAVCCAPHRFFRDKRLVFGGHLWLCGYAAVILAVMGIMMGLTEEFAAFLIFFGWAVAVPVILGTAASELLFRKSRQPALTAAAEPEWKKFVNHQS